MESVKGEIDAVVTSIHTQNAMLHDCLTSSQDGLNTMKVKKEFTENEVNTVIKTENTEDLKNNVFSLNQEPKDILVDDRNNLSTHTEMENGDRMALDISNKEKECLKQLTSDEMGGDNCDNKDRLCLCNEEECKTIFTSSSDYNCHQSLHYNDKPIVNKITKCNEELSIKREFETHPGTKTFSAGIGDPCQDEKCNEKESIQHQDNTHRVKNILVCEFDGCGKIFPRQSDLTRHIRTHTGEKPFPCPFDGCSLIFGDKSNLYRHYKWHTNERAYVCKFRGCTKSFNQHSDLRIHYRTHTGEKPYSCLFAGCNMTFGDKSNLRRHSRRHNKEKLHRCLADGCKKCFIRPDDLARHSSTHTIVD